MVELREGRRLILVNLQVDLVNLGHALIMRAVHGRLEEYLARVQTEAAAHLRRLTTRHHLIHEKLARARRLDLVALRNVEARHY